MNDLRQILILGKRRQGKSTLALALALNRHDIVVIFDPDSQYQSCADIPIVVSSEQEIPIGMAAMARAIEDERLSTPVIISVSAERRILDKAWNFFSDTLSQFPGGYAVIIDEAWNLQRANTINPKLQDMIRSSGNRPQIGSGQIEHNEDFTLIQTSHRFADLSTNVRYVATDFYIFRTTMEHDVEALRGAFGDQAAATVPKLGDHQALHISDDHNGGVKIEILADPSKWMYELHNDDRLDCLTVDRQEVRKLEVA